MGKTRISALLWAGIAHRIANDSTRKSPDRGIINDIDMISVLLPYCDAMFIDRDMHQLIKYGPIKSDLQSKYKTQVFSITNKEDFLKYLNNKEYLNNYNVKSNIVRFRQYNNRFYEYET